MCPCDTGVLQDRVELLAGATVCVLTGFGLTGTWRWLTRRIRGAGPKGAGGSLTKPD